MLPTCKRNSHDTVKQTNFVRRIEKLSTGNSFAGFYKLYIMPKPILFAGNVFQHFLLAIICCFTVSHVPKMPMPLQQLMLTNHHWTHSVKFSRWFKECLNCQETTSNDQNVLKISIKQIYDTVMLSSIMYIPFDPNLTAVEISTPHSHKNLTKQQGWPRGVSSVGNPWQALTGFCYDTCLTFLVNRTVGMCVSIHWGKQTFSSKYCTLWNAGGASTLRRFF